MSRRCAVMCGGAVMIASVVSGCMGGDAGLELSAADALTAVAGQMEVTLSEYHQEVVQADNGREAEVIAAFIRRVRTDAADESAVDGHAGEFAAALGRIRGDREVEFERRGAARDNVGVLREVAGGLRRLAVESLTLDGEMRRYLEGWMNRKAEVSGEQ